MSRKYCGVSPKRRIGSILKIKNGSIQASELTAPIAASYSKNTSVSIIPANSENVKKKEYRDGLCLFDNSYKGMIAKKGKW